MCKIVMRLLLATILVWSANIAWAQVPPTAIPGLKLWLDGSDVYNTGTNPPDGTVVAAWFDKSGAGNNATIYGGQTGARVFSNQVNGKSVLRFARVSASVGCGYEVPTLDIRASALNAVSIFTVYKQGAQSGNQGLWGNDNGNWDRFFFSSWTTSGSANNGGASLGPTNPAATVPNAGIPGTVKLLTAVYNNGVTNGSAIYFNGQTVTTFTDNTDPIAAHTDLRIGLDGDNNYYNGDIVEMLVYNRMLTPCEIQQMNRYLGGKYGITFANLVVNAGGPATFPSGGSVTLSASTTGSAYQWLINNTPISGATGASYIATATGDYKVVVTNSCPDTSDAKLVLVNMSGPGNALLFDGINDYVDCGANTALGTTSIKTMECWVRFNSLAGDQEILSRSVVGIGAELLLTNNNLEFNLMGNSSANSHVDYPLTNLQTGTWYHLAATWDGSTKESMQLYVNGLSVGTRTDAGNINTTGVPVPAGSTFKIGQWSGTGINRYFNGAIDEVRLWSTVKTQAQLQSAYNNVITLPATGLSLYYKFDQGIAGGNNPSINFAYDLSGNAMHGSLKNFALSGAASNWVESYAMVVPQLTAATNTTQIAFTANWTQPVIGFISNYYLDVSTVPTFATFIPGYNGATIYSLSQAVTGLSAFTTYYYRVRANKTSVPAQGAFSGTGVITTPTTNVNISTISLVLCNGDQNGALQAQSITNGPNYYFKWYKNGVLFTSNIATTAGTTMTSVANNLGAGTYKAEMYTTANALVNSATYTLTEPTVLNMGKTTTPALCYGSCDGTVQLSAAGGTGPYKYSFNNSTLGSNPFFAGACAGTFSASVADNNGCPATDTAVIITQPVKVVLGTNITNALCHDSCNGKLTLSATGGAGAYKYSFNNSGFDTVSAFAGICAGAYPAKVKDVNGCVDSTSAVPVGQPQVIVLNKMLSLPTCVCDGIIALTATGGTAPYRYNINAVLPDTTTVYAHLCSGVYSATVTDVNGCVMSTPSISLLAPAALTLTNTITQPTCNNKCNGVVQLSATGGNKPYSYIFNNGAAGYDTAFSALCSGVYSAKVTDTSGCISVIPTITLINPAALGAGLVHDTLICKGNSLLLNAANGGQGQYSWTANNGLADTAAAITVRTPALYKVTVNRPDGCTYKDSSNVRVTSDTAVRARILVTSHAFINDSVVIVNLTDTPYQSQAWTLPIGATILSQAYNNAILKMPATGEYGVGLRIRSYDACYSYDTGTVIISIADSNFNSANQILIRDVAIAPNPSTTGNFACTVTLNMSGKLSVRVYSLSGVGVYNALLSDQGKTVVTHQFTLPAANKGSYVLVLQTANATEVRNIVVN